jgi:Alginate lyase
MTHSTRRGLPRRALLLSAVAGAALAACGGGEELAEATADDETLANEAEDALAKADEPELQGKPAPPPLVDSFKDWQLELPVDSTGGTTGKPAVLNWPFTGMAASLLKNHLTIANRAITVRASPWGAVTSPLAGGARCEFKQATAVRWDPATASRSLQLTLTISRLPAAASASTRAAMHVAQVHDGQENLIMVTARTRPGGKGAAKETGSLTVTFNHGGSAVDLDTGFVVGDTVDITLSCRAGQGTVSLRNHRSGHSATRSATLTPLDHSGFFKVGAYPQRLNAAAKTSAGVVVIKALTVGS